MYRWPCIYGVTSTSRAYGAAYNIVAVDTVGESFSIAGDQTAEFAPGVTFEVNGSTGNDGDWVVNMSVFIGGNTLIIVTGDITNAVADGALKAYTIPVADELRIVFWDTVTSAFVQTTICTDSLQGQWTNQRCGIAYSTAGEWGVAHIEAVSNDLEYWQNANANWIADGAWNLLDDDNNKAWLAVDVETRQNFVHGMLMEQPLGVSFHGCYIDLSAGVPNWVIYTGAGMEDSHYSIAMTQQLSPWYVAVFRDTADQSLNLAESIYAGYRYVDTGRFGDYPQIVADKSDYLWIFATINNVLYGYIFPSVVAGPLSYNETVGMYAVYAATTLASNHKATHNPVDDTIHVILVDTIPAGNELIYLRRTANGWSDPITLQTSGALETFSWPQITCDSFNNINVYYIHDGDLVNLLLPSADYADFDTPANWDKTTNVDDSADTIKHCLAIENMPENV